MPNLTKIPSLEFLFLISEVKAHQFSLWDIAFSLVTTLLYLLACLVNGIVKEFVPSVVTHKDMGNTRGLT